MKTITFLLFFIIEATLMSSAFAQQDPIFKLDKKDIIGKAEAVFRESYPDFRANNFDRVQLSKNTKGDYLLTFSNAIEYIPLGKSYYYSAECLFSLIDKKDSLPEIKFKTKGVSEKRNELPDAARAKIFYVPDSKDKKAIQFVLKALKKNNPEWSISPEIQVVITEGGKEYEVRYESEWISAWDAVNKSDGKVTNWGHGHNDPPPVIEGEGKWGKLNW